MANYHRASQVLFKLEGGYVNHPNDRGGATNHGISLRFLRSQDPEQAKEWDIDKDGDIDENDIMGLSEEGASEIYRTFFWSPHQLDKIQSQAVANALLGMIVNVGPKPAIKVLQEALNTLTSSELKCDGIIGDKTIHAINFLSPYRVLNSYKDEMKVFYRNLAERDKRLQPFLKGWLNRVDAYE